jgi:hypothetical protein
MELVYEQLLRDVKLLLTSITTQDIVREIGDVSSGFALPFAFESSPVPPSNIASHASPRSLKGDTARYMHPEIACPREK